MGGVYSLFLKLCIASSKTASVGPRLGWTPAAARTTTATTARRATTRELTLTCRRCIGAPPALVLDRAHGTEDLPARRRTAETGRDRFIISPLPALSMTARPSAAGPRRASPARARPSAAWPPRSG